MLPSAAELVARFLRSNGYDETLDSFIKEAGLPPDVGSSSSSGITIEQILQEKKTFDLSLKFEKLGVDDGQSWRTPAPSNAFILGTLPTKSNILSVSTLDLVLPGSAEPKPCIAATTADRKLNLIDPAAQPFPLLQSHGNLQDSPILDLAVIGNKYLLASSMSGRLLLFNTATDEVVDERKHHSKYLVKIASWSNGDFTIIATAGWDAKVFLYSLKINGNDSAELGEPFATLTLQSIPEALLFIESPGESLPVILLTRRDSTFLYYYAFSSPTSTVSEIMLLGKQNLAPHSNAWIAFSPSDVRLCPTDPSIVAVATSSTPHMKLLVVRLLVPPSTRTASGEVRFNLDSAQTAPPETQVAQARTELLIQDREEAAILININTMASQSAYSTPRLVWRPDGSGIYVSSDDGLIRGFESSTGKLMATLTAHDPGSKIRCLWSGRLKFGASTASSDDAAQEYLMSGGFDQKLIIWSAN